MQTYSSYNKTPLHEYIRGNGIVDPFILNPGTIWEWTTSRSGRFDPDERAPDTHWTGGWSGFKSQSERGGEEK